MSKRKPSEQDLLSSFGTVFEFMKLLFHALRDQGGEDEAIRIVLKKPSVANTLATIILGEQEEIQHVTFLLVEETSSPVFGIIARVCNTVRSNKDYIGVTNNMFYRSNSVSFFNPSGFVAGTMQTLYEEFSKWLREQLAHGDIVLHMTDDCAFRGSIARERLQEILALNGLSSNELECISIESTSEICSMSMTTVLLEIINEWRNKLRRDLSDARSSPS